MLHFVTKVTLLKLILLWLVWCQLCLLGQVLMMCYVIFLIIKVTPIYIIDSKYIIKKLKSCIWLSWVHFMWVVINALGVGTHTRTPAHTHTHTHLHAHTHLHTHTPAHTHTRTHACTRIRMHTPTSWTKKQFQETKCRAGYGGIISVSELRRYK